MLQALLGGSIQEEVHVHRNAVALHQCPPGPKSPGKTGPPPGIGSIGSKSSTNNGPGEAKGTDPSGVAPISSTWSSGINSLPILMPSGAWSPVFPFLYPKRSPGYTLRQKFQCLHQKFLVVRAPVPCPQKAQRGKGGGHPSKIANSKGQKMIKNGVPPKGKEGLRKSKGPLSWPIMPPAQNPSSHMVFVCPEGEIPLPPTPKKKTAAPSYFSKEKSKLSEAPVNEKMLPPKSGQKGKKAKLTLPPVWMPLLPSMNSSKFHRLERVDCRHLKLARNQLPCLKVCLQNQRLMVQTLCRYQRLDN